MNKESENKREREREGQCTHCLIREKESAN